MLNFPVVIGDVRNSTVTINNIVKIRQSVTNQFTAVDGVNWEIRTLHKSYPHTRRNQPTDNLLLSKNKLSATILPTSWAATPDTSAHDEPEEDKHEDHSLVEYRKYIMRGGKLSDGCTDISVGSIVAVMPDRKNAIPWFARVVEILPDEDLLQIIYLHRQANTNKYYYKDDNVDTVHNDAVICNGVEFEPCFKDTTMVWKLLTPVHFIQALNSNSPPTITYLVDTTKIKPNLPQLDISTLIFASKDEFVQFVQKF